MIVQATIKVQIGGITEGNPPLLSYYRIATRPDGHRRLFSQAVTVTDAGLLERLRCEVKNGDDVEVKIEQYIGEGKPSVLLDFSMVEANVPALSAAS